ncbi:MAG: 4'-phosphopantetheinyl transferase superfamily protein [Bacteroidetes bacterium]|nr:4'-phosphopantetheinyl transferase superfamily protein [Bacteroidota bacterium]
MLEIFAIKLVDKKNFERNKIKLISKLQQENAAKYNNYKHTDSLQRTLLGELLMRQILSIKLNISSKDIIFQKGDNGKPYIRTKKMFFNISHSGKWVVGAFSNKEVGIDIELIREPNYEVAKRFYSCEELTKLNNIENKELKKDYFFDLWTLKESYLKAIGTGLTKPLSSFTVNVLNEDITLVDKMPIDNIYFKQYQFDKEYKLAVCSFDDSFCKEIKTLEIEDL